MLNREFAIPAQCNGELWELCVMLLFQTADGRQQATRHASLCICGQTPGQQMDALRDMTGKQSVCSIHS